MAIPSHVELARSIGKSSKNTVLTTLIQSQDSLGAALVRLETEIDDKLKCKATTLDMRQLETQMTQLGAAIEAELKETQAAINSSADSMVEHLLKHNERINGLQRQMNELIVMVRKLQAEKLQPTPTQIQAPVQIPAEIAALPKRVKSLEDMIGNYVILAIVLSVCVTMGFSWFLPVLDGRNRPAPVPPAPAPTTAPIQNSQPVPPQVMETRTAAPAPVAAKTATKKVTR